MPSISRAFRWLIAFALVAAAALAPGVAGIALAGDGGWEPSGAWCFGY